MTIEEIITFRHKLHQNPEVSNNEFITAETISEVLIRFHPDAILNLGKTGKSFVFDSKKEGPVIMFRAELDALPIAEKNTISYVSANDHVAHVCGHDGHMAILVGLASQIAQYRPKKGKAVILFQPAEESEQGAKDVIEDPNFRQIEPDYIFGLHNIPGFEKHKILFKEGSFTSASKAMIIKLTGKTSHAAEPEKGINPAMAISKIITQSNKLVEQTSLFNDFVLLTIIHIRLGEIAFGTSPGEAEVMITLRSFENSDMDILSGHLEKIVYAITKEEKIKTEISFLEIFPATVNHSDCIEIINQATIENKFISERLKTSFRWGEDFGYYTTKYKGGFFGLGSGKEQPALHNPDFDFPDDIIETGIKMFYSIYRRLIT